MHTLKSHVVNVNAQTIFILELRSQRLDLSQFQMNNSISPFRDRVSLVHYARLYQ